MIVVFSGSAMLIAVVVAIVIASRSLRQSVPLPEVPEAQTPAGVRVKAVERKTEAVVERGEVVAASGAVAIVCGEDAERRASVDCAEARFGEERRRCAVGVSAQGR